LTKRRKSWTGEIKKKTGQLNQRIEAKRFEGAERKKEKGKEKKKINWEVRDDLLLLLDIKIAYSKQNNNNN